MYDLNQITCSRDQFTLQVDHCRLERGVTYAIVGPNSSGKTTFLDLLALQRPSSEGRLRFNGQAVDWDNRRTLLGQRRRIAYLMQNPYLFSTSVAGNIAYGLELRGLDRQEIGDRVDAIAQRLSLEDLLTRSSHRLSGGEAQRVALARTLVLDADVYLLDEPTNNVDRQHVHLVEDVIRELSAEREVTVALTTHAHEQAYRLSTHHITIIDGRLSDVAYENVLAGTLREETDGVRIVSLTDGGAEFLVSEGAVGPVTLAIDPQNLILSASHLESSALNSFEGTVTRAEVQGDSLRVFLDVGVPLCALVTSRSFEGMGLNVGRRVWVTFKATSVRVL